MSDNRERRSLVIVSFLVAFGLGVIFGVLASRNSRRYLPSPRVALAPGVPEPASPLQQSAPSGPLDPVVPSPASKPAATHPDSIPGDGTAYASAEYPIKGNKRSGIYHVPGGFAYDRTVATILFRTVEDAEAAGYRASKA